MHQQDVRVPLGLPRPIPPDQLTWLLTFAMTPAGSRETGGGPGQALLMAICGRPGFLDDLSGDGVRVLAARGASADERALRSAPEVSSRVEGHSRTLG